MMIKKRIVLLIFATALLSLPGKTQTDIAEDTIDGTVIWKTDTILLTGDVLIENGAVLTVEPKVQIISQGYYKIDVQGSIKAVGTVDQPILFTVNDTTGFIDTTITAGGWNGIEFQRTSIQNDSSLFKHCIFEYGKAIGPRIKTGQGGAIYVDSFPKVKVSHCVFRHNIATFRGGGIFLSQCGNVKIKESVFHHNICGYNGGGICSFDGCAPLIIDNVFYRNVAFYQEISGPIVFTGGSGGGLYIQTQIQGDTPRVINNVIANNRAGSTSGLYESTLHAQIVSNIIVNNSALGATLFCGSQISEAKYYNNTIVNNRGIGFEYASSFIKIRNNIIRQNLATTDTVAIDNLNSELLLEGEPDIFYNNIGGESLGNSNIDAPAQFVDPTLGYGLEYDGLDSDWSLEKSSPEVDAGTVMGIEMDLPSTDVYGNPRITGEDIDMGAAEYDFSSDIEVPESDEYITVYPNPFSGQLWIEIDKQFLRGVHVQVVNANGQIIAHREYHTDIMEFQSRSWPSGPYYLNILSEQGKLLHSAKVIKQ